MIAKIVVVSKTRMSDKACVGGITEDGRSVRLLNSECKNQDLETEFEIGSVWEINYIDRFKLEPPHIEDICIQSKNFIGPAKDLIGSINKIGRIHNGDPSLLFDGRLQIEEHGKSYINRMQPLPSHSTSFWRLPELLQFTENNYGKVRYVGNFGKFRLDLPFVGFEEPIRIIPRNTIVRLSLARWWDQDGKTEPRCYLQLSGWYLP